MAGKESNLFLDPRLMEQELDEGQKRIREKFVDNYLKSFDPVEACIACGYHESFANEYARRFMFDAYVRRLIQERRREPSDEANEKEADIALAKNALREAAQKADYNTRVRASVHLLELYGLSKPRQEEADESELVEALKEFAARAPV